MVLKSFRWHNLTMKNMAMLFAPLYMVSSLFFILYLTGYVCIFQPELFLGLLVKAMKNDVILKRVAAFSKRLLQVCWLNCSKVILLMWILLKFAI
jgi:hypothetical protein